MKLPTHIPNAMIFQKLETGRVFYERRINSNVESPIAFIHLHNFTVNSQKKVQHSTLEEKLLSLIKHS